MLKNPQDRRAKRTAVQIKETMFSFMKTKAIHEIKVSEICKLCQINRATFYNHYASPTALLNEMEQQLVSQLKLITRTPNSIEDIADQMEQYCTKLKENAKLVEILVRYHADRDLEEIITKLTEYYEKNRLDVNKTAMDPDTTHLVSTFLYAGSYQLVQEWLLRDIDKTPKEIAQLVLSIVSKEYL